VYEISQLIQKYIQLNDVWMPEQLEILDFSTNLPYYIETLYLLPIENFYSHLVASQLMNSNWQQ